MRRLTNMVSLKLPYRRVDWNTHKVTDKIDYLTADEEDSFVVAQANSPLNEDGSFVNDVVMARYVSENLEVPVERVDYMDVSPKQVVAVATACIPFLESDDSNRALMGGANTQRQSCSIVKSKSTIHRYRYTYQHMTQGLPCYVNVMV